MRTLKKVTMDGIKRPPKYTTPDEQLLIAASVRFCRFGMGAYSPDLAIKTKRKIDVNRFTLF
jgi:hypothetical protein